MTRTRDLLILRAPGLADLLTGLPACRGLRRHFPQHNIVLAAPAHLAELAMISCAFDEVLPTDGLADLRWKRPAPDVAVNLHGKGPRSHQALLALEPRRRIGFRAPGWSGPTWDPGEHDISRWCRLLETAGIATDPTHLRLPLPGVPSVAPGAVVIHPGASSPSRCWPPGRYAEVARRLAASGAPVVITGSAAERSLAGQVARQAGLPETTVLAGDLSVLEFAATIASARLLICGDTGAGHLATAYATPSVLLFGPMSPRLWGPPASQYRHRVLWYGPHRGERFASRPDPALLAITPDQVLSAARNQLRVQTRMGWIPIGASAGGAVNGRTEGVRAERVR
ncbi:MAG: glycosyltransferase family 9 protein [Mycobacteriales bacterium]